MQQVWRSLEALAPFPPEPDDWISIAAIATAPRPGELWAGWRHRPSFAAACSIIAVSAIVGATSGFVLWRGMSTTPPSFEAAVLGDTMGLLGWRSPAAGFAHGVEPRTASRGASWGD